jgi:mannose-6-phosphate isomerase-like protein (cupin superfamily)
MPNSPDFSFKERSVAIMTNSRVIKIGEMSTTVPAGHYDLQSRHIVDVSMSKTLKASQITMDPSGRADAHVHAQADQFFIVLSGEMGMRIEGEEYRLKPREAVFIHAGEKHQNYNLSPGKTEYLVITNRIDMT